MLLSQKTQHTLLHPLSHYNSGLRNFPRSTLKGDCAASMPEQMLVERQFRYDRTAYPPHTDPISRTTLPKSALANALPDAPRTSACPPIPREWQETNDDRNHKATGNFHPSHNPPLTASSRRASASANPAPPQDGGPGKNFPGVRLPPVPCRTVEEGSEGRGWSSLTAAIAA